MNIEEFSRYLAEHDRARRTIDGYRAELGLFVAWYEGSNGERPSTAKITPIDIKDWREFMNARGLSPATINRRLAALRAYFRWAVQTSLISLDPTVRIRSKKADRRAPRWLNRNELNNLRKAAQIRLQVAEKRGNDATAREARRDRAILALLMGAGLRLSELVDLKIGDLTLQPRSGHVVVRSGKGGRWRKVPLNSDVRKTVAEWLDVRPADETSLFVGRRGKRLRPRGVERIINRLAQDAKLEPSKVTPHTLRHSFAKALIDADQGLEKVQILLGHENIVTTTRYTTPGDRDLEAAVERVAWSDV